VRASSHEAVSASLRVTTTCLDSTGPVSPSPAGA
jgi:hypothetical protein